MSIVASYYLDEIEHREAPLAHHRAGLSYTRTGYGSRIPSRYMVKIPGGSGRWRRVYTCCFSNAGTSYVDVPGGWAVIR